MAYSSIRTSRVSLDTISTFFIEGDLHFVIRVEGEFNKFFRETIFLFRRNRCFKLRVQGVENLAILRNLRG